MQSYKNEITVTRGETFTIDKTLVNKDGSPYIVSSKLNNPYWLLSISNTVYSQENRYVKNYWLPVNEPCFNSTIALNIKDIKVSADSDTPLYNSLKEITNLPIVGYINGVAVSFDIGTDTLFYDDTIDKYMYWDDGWKEYECRIIKTFLREDTIEWTSQNYQYSIQLVSGSVDFNSDEPLSKIDTSYTILLPTKIKVIDDVNGGLS